jgi:catechol 2,3-dioxygenase-like lactoylglutathione lyase family enzyme
MELETARLAAVVKSANITLESDSPVDRMPIRPTADRTEVRTYTNQFSRRGDDQMMKLAKEAVDMGVLSGDIDASLNFYRDVLGLEFVEKMPASNGTMYRLRFGRSDFKLIDPTNKPPQGPVGFNNQLGFRTVAFCISNLTEVCEELRSKGVEFVVEEKQARPGVRIAMVKDPDGNIVEFVERS